MNKLALEENAASSKNRKYVAACKRIWLLIDASTDWIAAMSTVACELNASFTDFNWTGFYRTVRKEHLQVGPYQGEHGCIDIPYSQGVCGTAARTKRTQVVTDVREIRDHIACSTTTLSEIVVPVLSPSGGTIAVLDVDSDRLGAFDDVDQRHLEELCALLGERFGAEAARLIRVR